MSTQILATKLYTPGLRPGLVLRSRLLDQLNAGTHGKLTLVSAPAGFGKTTLITAWISSGERPVAWLSLDNDDSDPVRFLMYVVAALQTIESQIATGILNALESPQPPPVAPLLTPLLNELATMPHEFVLVLDDYHTLDSQEIDAALTFLIDNQPPQMHLVITTREDPRLPLARLRARGQLSEIRAADLRFTADEAAQFLNHAMGLSLSPADVTALEQRTEGWIAGLQLAAISMQGQQDTGEFIRSFTGSHHFVLDYLIEEVLNQQPSHIRTFLLKTAILESMCAPLCDAILWDDVDTQATLEHIRQANLFLIPLDNERRWYRYHHLFVDLLRKHLGQSADINVNTLYIRASMWYEANGFDVEAFTYAAKANDIARAQRLIEGDNTPLYLRGGVVPVLRWLGSLPQSTFDQNPSLSVTYAVASTVAGQQIDGVEDRLQAAEIALQNADTPHLFGQIAAVRGMLAVPHGDVETMRSQSNIALELLHPDRVSMRLFALWTKGLAHQQLGENAAARQIFAQTALNSESSGNTMMALAAFTGLGQLQEADQQHHQAQQSYLHVLALVGDPPWPMACEACLGLARIAYARNNLDHAAYYARQGLELGRQLENVDTPIVSGILLARLQMTRGDLQGAADTLTDAERLIEQRGFVDKLPEIRAAQASIKRALTHHTVTRSAQPLIEPLSDREMEILRLVAEGLSNREIGDRLFLALDTVKGHNRRIYAKLGVRRRTEAIARARELGLL